MANGIAKLQLLLEMKNRIGGVLNSAKDRVKKATGEMQSKSDAFKVSSIKSFNAIKSEIPGVGRAMEMITNPVVAVTASVAALGYGIIKCMNEAERFSGGFRQLQMLNIDKSVKDMGRLKSMIRATSYEKGFDPTDTTKAFFDVQSTTGKFGGEVNAIVAKQGEFARLMQADFKQWIAGTAKAMANYGFGADKLDEFNKAAFATVQTGVTTFDELAQVQSMFAGAAAASKQSFASADKMFSIFTVKVKDVNEAATLTKSLFNDLSKAETINSFKKIGINVFDANKHFKQADILLLELQKKFRELGTSDSKLIQLKNQFAGSEGLIAFVQAATDKTNQLQTTINTFDATQFALPKALEIAKKDINYINEQLENKTKVLMGELGDKFMPLKMLFAKGAINVLDEVNNLTKSGKELDTEYLDKIKSDAATKVLKEFPGLSNPVQLSDSAFADLTKNIDSELKHYQFFAEQNKKFKDKGQILDRLSNANSLGFKNYQFASEAITTLTELKNQAITARSKVPHGDRFGVPGEDGKTDKSSSPVNPLTDNVQSIAAGSQTKSVTINIDSFVKTFSPTNQAINGMGKD